MADTNARGFSLLEMLVSLAVLVLIVAALAAMLIQNARLNKAQRVQTEIQANARNCLSLIVQQLRTAGWDPAIADIPLVALDPDPTDAVSEIEIFADLDADGLTSGVNEQVAIRHVADRVEWRRSSSTAYSTMAEGISNDADGDGIVEPLFVPVPNPDPAIIRVQVTARALTPDPRTGEFQRYTVHSDVALRKRL